MGNCLDGFKDDPNNAPETKPGTASNGNANSRKSSDKIIAKPKKSFASSSATTIHAGILRENNLDVYQKYSELEVLGNGSMGHVAKVVLKDSARRSLRNLGSNNSSDSSDIRSSTGGNAVYALKSIHLDRISTSFLEELKNEIDILKTMDHPNIVKLHEVFSHKKQIYMILELCDGGDLYTRLPYTEKDSAYITGKLLSAVKYMHDHGIVHRDLKFENIMFENKGADAEIKVIDFGLSKKFVTSKLGVMREGVGTLYSMAPQVLQGIYTSQADMWSVGVITYMLLSSHRPFYSKKRKVMIDRIMRVDYSFEKDYWQPVSATAKDFIDKLLVMDPKVRYTAEKAQTHEWMNKEFKLQDRIPSESMTGRVTDILSAYKNNLPLKKLALNVIAHRSTTDEIINLRKAFDQFDDSNDGVISSMEFKTALRDKCSYTETELQEMFDSIDINQNGHIMYTEFIAATLEAQGQIDEERIAEAFERLDVDDTGFISKENMQEFLADTGASTKDAENIIQEADKDNCGQVSYDEFLDMFRSQAGDEVTKTSLMKSLKTYHDGAVVPIERVENRESKKLDANDLVGLDAVIPGGRYDSSGD